MTGIIVKGIGGFYYVKTADGSLFETKARGIFRKDGIKPTVGDNVEFENGSIIKIFERKSYLIRPSVSNIDNLIIVVAAKDPEPDLFLVDKLSVACLYSGIKPIICINKTDILKPQDIYKMYKDIGFDVFMVSAEKNIGCEELVLLLKGKVSAFAGLSGVGKTTLINLVTGEDGETGEVSKINRGRHTTRHVELFSIDKDTYILDTPGFSSLMLSDICRVKKDELSEYFPELSKYNGECRFKGCSHINEPDCAVKNAISNGKIAESRYESYKELYTELDKIKEWEKN